MNIEKVKVAVAQNGAWIALAAVVIFFAAINPRFISVDNISVILRQVAELGVVAIALAFVIMAGSIDLSIGANVTLSAVIGGLTMSTTQNVVAGIAAGLAVGVIAGSINGLLISYFGLNPIVITLGFMAAWGGLALYLTNGSTITGLPTEFGAVLSAPIGPVNLAVFVLVVVVVVSWILLNLRPVGRWILAIGENERAAYLMGISVRRTRFLLFVVSGAAAAVAGLMLIGKLRAAPPTLGQGMELDALTVVLLGGVAFAGGSGRIGGVLAGLLFVGVLRNGLVVIGVSQFLQSVAIGLTLVLAIALDGSLRRIIRSSWDRLGKASVDEKDSSETVASRV